MEGLINVQFDLHNSMKKDLSNFKKSPKERITIDYIDIRSESLETDWSTFRTNHSKLYEVSKPDILASSPYVVKEIYDITKDIYFNYKALLKGSLSQLTKTLVETQSDSGVSKTNSSPLVKLPKITIPIFSGSYSQWTTFKDLFVSLVHNNNALDNVQKLHYLKTHLTGEAEQLIRHTPISGANYDHCWSLLEQRYNNRKYLANCILNRFFGIKRLNSEIASGLKDLIDTTMDCLNALKNISIDVSSWDIIIIHVASSKLDPETRKQWELHVSSTAELNDLPTLDQFKTFIESRFRALEFIDTRKSLVQQSGGTNSKPKSFIAANLGGMRCEYCSDNHKLCFCKKFANEDISKKREFVANNSICFNCLGGNHLVAECNNPRSCRICRRRHHSLLHTESEHTNTNTVDTETTETSNDTSPIVSCISTQRISSHGQVLLATALVNSQTEFGGNYMLRVLLDQGSTACFITEAAVQMLRLKKSPARGVISGIGGDKPIISRSVVTLTITSRICPDVKMQITAYVLKTITTVLPERHVPGIEWEELQNLHLADPHFHTPNSIDMLLGANVYSQILQDGIKKNKSGNLVAQKTTLGWILSGTTEERFYKSKEPSRKLCVMHAEVTESDMLKKFWELEEQSYSAKKMWTEDEKRCEEIFETTTKRSDDGRYIVRLPFRDNQPGCLGGESRKIAVAKFQTLEKRLSKNLDLKKSYTEVINEYLHLGHMRHVSNNDSKKNKAVYLPHHAVIRSDKSTTKVRVVFNASSKNSKGISLNDTLMIGPKLQADLRHTVLRWRVHSIALVADIVKMYRQVRIAEEDTMFQRIVWRENLESEIQDFELLTVTFGTASAPYLAVRALNQISLDEGTNFPLASSKVLDSFYMDDLMTGCSSVEEGLEIYNQMKALLSKGGFELQKWSSNCEDLLKKIQNSEDQEKYKPELIDPVKNTPKENKEEIVRPIRGNKSMQHTVNNSKEKVIEEMKDENITKILGLTWDRAEDQFRYLVHLPQESSTSATKRLILSVIARLYDPLGWIAPSIIVAKTFIQKLWLAGVSWDDPIPEELQSEWSTYSNELEQLTKVHLPRWSGNSTSDSKVELHGFCDASKLAYAAVVYLRVVSRTGNIKVTLLAAKTRVAPIKQISIPRLELCGATLLSKLLAEIAEVLSIQKCNVRAWTDSTVVLAWLNSHPSKWKTFVANRVSDILTTLDSNQWYHVSSKDNPADCASRGLQPSMLAENELWFSGPKFLREHTVLYKKPTDLKVHLEELITSNFNALSEDTLFQRFSFLQKLLRVIAYCRRFYKRGGQRTTYLSKGEIDQARICCIRKAQIEEFHKEYFELKNCGYLQSKNSKLKSLCPYLDEYGVLRVSGRLQKSQLPENIKHPIILPHSSHFTKLVVLEAHHKTLHGGIQLMINYLRTAYWIIGVKNLVKQCIRKCVTCVRQTASIQTQFMGSLPSVRCTPARAFLHSGVDYAGPIQVRTTKGRGHRSYKGYICLFICMATRAIHLDMVSDMSTQAFLACFRRFVARRGHCAQLWSDNGTAFIGAAKELEQLKIIQGDVAEYLENNGTEWHFIPPHAPNFGGLWEAGIKATKHHLKRIIGESTLTFEEMCTLLTQIEACLNSRPISLDSSDPNDPRPLTPGHFLTGGPLVAVPDTHNYLNSNVSSLTRWQFIQRMLQSFWQRWSQEYLSHLMNRYKWNSKLPEPNLGDIVLIKEDNLPPSRWLMGRVLAKHPGTDNITRVITIKVKNSVIKRPTSKVCVLPISE